MRGYLGLGFAPIDNMDIFGADVLKYWCAGHDTASISRLVGQPESLVANLLPKVLQRHREQDLRAARASA